MASQREKPMFTINHLLYGNSVPPNTLPVETTGRSEALPSSTDTQESAILTKVVEEEERDNMSATPSIERSPAKRSSKIQEESSNPKRGKVTPQSSDKVPSVVRRPSILRGNTQSSRKVKRSIDNVTAFLTGTTVGNVGSLDFDEKPVPNVKEELSSDPTSPRVSAVKHKPFPDSKPKPVPHLKCKSDPMVGFSLTSNLKPQQNSNSEKQTQVNSNVETCSDIDNITPFGIKDMLNVSSDLESVKPVRTSTTSDDVSCSTAGGPEVVCARITPPQLLPFTSPPQPGWSSAYNTSFKLPNNTPKGCRSPWLLSEWLPHNYDHLMMYGSMSTPSLLSPPTPTFIPPFSPSEFLNFKDSPHFPPCKPDIQKPLLSSVEQPLVERPSYSHLQTTVGSHDVGKSSHLTLPSPLIAEGRMMSSLAKQFSPLLHSTSSNSLVYTGISPYTHPCSGTFTTMPTSEVPSTTQDQSQDLCTAQDQSQCSPTTRKRIQGPSTTQDQCQSLSTTQDQCQSLSTTQDQCQAPSATHDQFQELTPSYNALLGQMEQLIELQKYYSRYIISKSGEIPQQHQPSETHVSANPPTDQQLLGNQEMISGLSNPTVHHDGCRHGYCPHIEEQMKRREKRAKQRKSCSSKATNKSSKVKNYREEVKNRIQESIQQLWGRKALPKKESKSFSSIKSSLINRARELLHHRA